MCMLLKVAFKYGRGSKLFLYCINLAFGTVNNYSRDDRKRRLIILAEKMF